MPRSVLLALSLLALSPAAAHAYRLPEDLGPVFRNPADKLVSIAIDDEVYDTATHCDARAKKGVVAAIRWLERHASGLSWGTYRCEKWGKGSASLHAESRAIDWHPSSRAAAAKLIEELLAPDKAGNQHALARRMGVEELIWDCSYWGAGAPQFGKYDYCYGANGRRKKGLNPTAAHMDHVHIGFSRAGAAGRTSFWKLALK
ncbi:MAG: hypothetical protein ACJ762_12480 [Solirubrobacteraceae bacterium]